MVVLPARPALRALARGEPPLYAPLLEEISRRHPTLDLGPLLAVAARERSLGAVIGAHYTPEGNRRVGEALARWLLAAEPAIPPPPP